MTQAKARSDGETGQAPSGDGTAPTARRRRTAGQTARRTGDSHQNRSAATRIRARSHALVTTWASRIRPMAGRVRAMRPDLTGEEAVVAGVVAISAVVAAAAATGLIWLWVLAALLAAGGAGMLELGRRGRLPSPSPSRTTAPSRPRSRAGRQMDPRQRAEAAPFSVRTSLQSRHLLRVVDRARPRDGVVLAVSGGHRTQILIEGRSDEPVELRDVRAVITARRDPRPGEPIVADTGALPHQDFDVDLDVDPPRLVPSSAGHGPGLELPVTVDRDQVELVVLAPHSSGGEVDWHLELDWSCGTRSGTLTVDLGDRPFRLTAETGWTTFYPDGGPPVRTGWT